MSNDTTNQTTLTMQNYVSDMFALESHIEEAIDGQLRQPQDHPDASAAFHRLHAMVTAQRNAMKDHLESIGGDTSMTGMGAKGIVASLAGMAAGAINTMRSQAVSKALRDDYTAFSHAVVGYGMLFTTAKLLGFDATAQLADAHLRSYEMAIDEIARLIPEVVAWELRKDGHVFTDELAGRTSQAICDFWRGPSSNEKRHRSPSDTTETPTGTTTSWAA